MVLCGYISLIVLNIATRMDNSYTYSVGLVTLDFFGEAVAFHCLLGHLIRGLIMQQHMHAQQFPT